MNLEAMLGRKQQALHRLWKQRRTRFLGTRPTEKQLAAWDRKEDENRQTEWERVCRHLHVDPSLRRPNVPEVLLDNMPPDELLGRIPEIIEQLEVSRLVQRSFETTEIPHRPFNFSSIERWVADICAELPKQILPNYSDCRSDYQKLCALVRWFKLLGKTFIKKKTSPPVQRGEKIHGPVVDQVIREELRKQHFNEDSSIRQDMPPVKAICIARKLAKQFDRKADKLKGYVAQGFNRLFPDNDTSGYKIYQASCKKDCHQYLYNWFLRECAEGKAFTQGTFDTSDMEDAEQLDSLATLQFDD